MSNSSISLEFIDRIYNKLKNDFINLSLISEEDFINDEQIINQIIIQLINDDIDEVLTLSELETFVVRKKLRINKNDTKDVQRIAEEVKRRKFKLWKRDEHGTEYFEEDYVLVTKTMVERIYYFALRKLTKYFDKNEIMNEYYDDDSISKLIPYLSTRLTNILYRKKIFTLSQILQLTKNDMDNIHYLGENTQKELISIMNLFGYDWGSKNCTKKLKEEKLLETYIKLNSEKEKTEKYLEELEEKIKKIEMELGQDNKKIKVLRLKKKD